MTSADEEVSWNTFVQTLKQDCLPNEVQVRFRPAGRAPILRQQVYQIPANAPYSSVADKVNELLKRDRSSPIFCYIATSFVPAPDESVYNLWTVSGAPDV